MTRLGFGTDESGEGWVLTAEGTTTRLGARWGAGASSLAGAGSLVGIFAAAAVAKGARCAAWASVFAVPLTALATPTEVLADCERGTGACGVRWARLIRRRAATTIGFISGTSASGNNSSCGGDKLACSFRR